jgi:hypothetical protein
MDYEEAVPEPCGNIPKSLRGYGVLMKAGGESPAVLTAEKITSNRSNPPRILIFPDAGENIRINSYMP